MLPLVPEKLKSDVSVICPRAIPANRVADSRVASSLEFKGIRWIFMGKWYLYRTFRGRIRILVGDYADVRGIVKAWKYPFLRWKVLQIAAGAVKTFVQMTLESEDWQAINGCLLRLYKELESEKHTRLMLELIHELVPIDSGAVNFYTLPDKLSAIVFPEDAATEEQLAQIGRYCHQSPFGAYYVATRDASWKMMTDFIPLEDFHKLDLYQLALKPLGVTEQASGLLAFMDGTMHLITLHRTDRGFTEREREILNTLQPHLVASHINALVCSRANLSVEQIRAAMETAPGAYGYFDAKGKVAWLQEKAKAWLREFFPGEVMHQEFIPHGLQELVRESLLEGSAPRQLTQAKENEVLVVCLGASPLGGLIMRLERKPESPLPRFRPLPQFSKRKNEVLQWMVEGKRNAEIAKILCLSPRTVEKHVSEIIAALNVENRASAILVAMGFCASANGV